MPNTSITFSLLALLAMLGVSDLAGQADSLPPCASPVALQATVRADNDISFSSHDGTRTTIPTIVKRKIDALAGMACFDARATSNETPPLDRFYGGAFLVRGADSTLVYFFDRSDEVGAADVYYFMLFDPVAQRVTPRPAAIFAKWARDDDDVCHRPFVTFEDLDQDGRPELVVRERTHNGSSYNACVRHYYRIGRDLSLDPILAVEERSWQDVRTPDTWLVRRIRFVSRDSLVMATFLQVPGQAEREVGELVVSKHPTEHLHTTVYYVADTRVIDPKYRDALMTDSPAHDDSFIFTGGTPWY